MQLNTQGKKSVDDFSSLPLPGRYHAGVKAIKEDPEAVLVEFEVFAGTVPTQEKKTINANLGKKETWMVEQLTRFAMAAGLIEPESVKEVIFADAIGRQLLIEVEDRVSKKDGKTYRNVSRGGFWPIGHQNHKDVPLDQTMLRLHQGQAPAPTPGPAPPVISTGAGSAEVLKPDFKPPAQAAAPPAPGKKWGDL